MVGLCSQSFATIIAAGYSLSPNGVVQIPTDGLFEPAFEVLSRTPPEFAMNFRSVDRVALIVSRAVLNECDQ